jgi:hypothetical protein
MKGRAGAFSEFELRLLRAKMAQHGLKTAALAAAIGFKSSNVTNVLSGNTKSWRVLKAINVFFEERIFTKPARIRKPQTHKAP